MTVSKIASKIYQAAKAVCKGKGIWNWRSEWSKAMKQAWKQLINGDNEMNVTKPGVAEANGIRVEVKITKKVVNKRINLDGDIVKGEGELYDGFSAKIFKNKKLLATCDDRAFCYVLDDNSNMRDKGAHARFGNKYLAYSTWILLQDALASADAHWTGGAEYKALAAKIAAKKEEQRKNSIKNAVDRKEKIANGYCEKCGSYCYGDCEA